MSPQIIQYATSYHPNIIKLMHHPQQFMLDNDSEDYSKAPENKSFLCLLFASIHNNSNWIIKVKTIGTAKSSKVTMFFFSFSSVCVSHVLVNCSFVFNKRKGNGVFFFVVLDLPRSQCLSQKLAQKQTLKERSHHIFSFYHIKRSISFRMLIIQISLTFFFSPLLVISPLLFIVPLIFIIHVKLLLHFNKHRNVKFAS